MQADQGWAGLGEGPWGQDSQPAPSPDWAGLLAEVDVIVTGHSGHYGVLVVGFLYI